MSYNQNHKIAKITSQTQIISVVGQRIFGSRLLLFLPYKAPVTISYLKLPEIRPFSFILGYLAFLLKDKNLARKDFLLIVTLIGGPSSVE